MKVEKANFNVPMQQTQNASKLAHSLASASYTPNFGSKYKSEDIYNELMKYMPKKVKFMLKVKEWTGEVQNIIINSIGTGLIAPIFIKYNPLSDTDEDTRTYSAWRQPVSAVLAILTQVGATMPFNNKVKNMAHQGKLGQDYNMTPYMDDKYLQKLVKKQHPDYTKAQVKEAAALMKKEQLEELLKDLRTKNTVMFIEDGKPNKVPMNSKRYRETLLSTIESLIKDETEEQEKNANTKRTLRIKRSEYYRNNADKANAHLDSLDKIFDSGDIAQVKKELTSKLAEMKSKHADKELIKFTEEIFKLGEKSNDNKTINSMRAKVQRAKSYVHDYSAMTSKEQVIERVNRSIAGRVTDIDKTLKFFQKVKNAIEENKTVYEIEAMFTKEKMVNKRLEEKSIDFALKVAEQLKKQTKACLDGYKQVGGIFVSLATLFVSCPLLNWVYPRFMAAVFPNLSNGKHTKDTTSLIEQANSPVQQTTQNSNGNLLDKFKNTLSTASEKTIKQPAEQKKVEVK